LAFRISENARRDLIGIWGYIADDSEEAADSVVSALYDQFDLLGKSIFLGRRRDDLLPGYRSVTAQDYVILYRVVGEDVEITRVIHGRRDIDAALDE